MKKITAIIIAAMMLAGTTANAAWEFDEKVLTENKTQPNFTFYKGTMYVYYMTCVGKDCQYYNEQFFDLYGNPITKEEYWERIRETDDSVEYFTLNRKSIIDKIDDKTVLKDLNGNILAEDFRMYYGERQRVASAISKNGKVGIMAYDGRIIVPCEYKYVKLYTDDLYSVEKDGVKTFYNYNGEKLFTKSSNIDISQVGKELIAVEKYINGEKIYALMDLKGNYLTDFIYEKIYIYDNPEEWQGGEFAWLENDDTEMYVNRQLKKIDIDWEDTENVRCHSYTDLGQTAILKKYGTYSLFDKVNKEFVIPYSNYTLSKCGEYILKNNRGDSYLLDLNGHTLFKFEHSGSSFKGFDDGVAMLGTWACDTEGKNIFSKEYLQVHKIDNNEFAVWNPGSLKILTAKGIIGEALYTDVKIDINGVQIPCRSIYGYAGVVAEDLRNFGFDVIWDEEKRLLNITRNPDYYNITPMEYEQDGNLGEHYANIYGSDINVEYNGKRISSYCIDGRTLIKAEDLATDGITFNYDDSVRTLYMSVDGLERR